MLNLHYWSDRYMTLTKTRLLLFALSSGFLLLSCNHEDEYVPKLRIIKVSIEGTTESKFQVTRILKKDTVAVSKYEETYRLDDDRRFCIEAFCEDKNNLLTVSVWKDGVLSLVVSDYSHVKTGSLY